MPGVLAVLPATAPGLDTRGSGEPIVIRLTLASDDALAGVLRALVLAGADVRGCETRELSLEEIYVHTLTPGAATTPVLVSQAMAR